MPILFLVIKKDRVKKITFWRYIFMISSVFKDKKVTKKEKSRLLNFFACGWKDPDPYKIKMNPDPDEVYNMHTRHLSKKGLRQFSMRRFRTWKSNAEKPTTIRCLFSLLFGGESWNHLACLSMTICRFLCLNASSISFLYRRAQGY